MPTPEPVEADSDATTRNGAFEPEDDSEGPATPPPHAADDAVTTADSTSEGSETDQNTGRDAPATPSRADLLPSPFIVLLVGVTALAGWFSWTRAELDWGGDGSTVYLPFVFVLAGWVVSLALHEFAHAALAYRFGDRSLRGSGYLRLNPFGFRELFANLLLPAVIPILGGIGMTGPASYIDHTAVTSRRGRALVALAGPATSLLIAAALAVTIGVLVPADSVTDNWALAGLMFLCHLNLTAALISLLPVPGLDAFDAVAPYLSQRVARRGRAFALFGVIAVFGVLWFPYVNTALFELMHHLFALVGLPQIDVGFGRLVFQFWGL